MDENETIFGPRWPDIYDELAEFIRQLNEEQEEDNE